MEGDNEPVTMKRVQNETEKDNVGGKWRKREGIKRNLRDLPRKSYEECEDDCNEFDQSKKSKFGINCILAALNHDVIWPLKEAELQPISEQGLPNCPGAQQPPEEERQQPISEPAVSGGSAPVQTRALTGCRDSTNRLYSVDRYSAEQTNESAANRAEDGIQGGEKANGERCSVQFTRNKRKKNSYKPGYIMKTLIFLLFLVGSTVGAGLSKGGKETSLRAEGFDCLQTAGFSTTYPGQWSHNKPWRTNEKLNQEPRLSFLQPLFPCTES